MAKEPALLKNVGRFVKKNPWLGVAIGATAGIVFGSGSVWSYLNHQVSVASYELEQVKAQTALQRELLDLHGQIISQVKVYLDARDSFFRLPNGATNYQLQNGYAQAKSRLVALVSDYNSIEARLSTLEVRQPIWFNASAIIPPVSPAISIASHDPSPTLMKIDIQQRHDEALPEIALRLKALFEQYGQKYGDPIGAK